LAGSMQQLLVCARTVHGKHAVLRRLMLVIQGK